MPRRLRAEPLQPLWPYASAGLRWAGVVQYVLPRSYPHSQIKNWLLGFRTVSVYIDMCVYRSRLLSGTLRVLEANYKPTISQPISQPSSQLIFCRDLGDFLCFKEKKVAFSFLLLPEITQIHAKNRLATRLAYRLAYSWLIVGL